MIMKQYVPEVRFDGFTADWATKPLSKIAHVIDPHPSHRAPEAVANGVPFIGIGDVAENGYVDFKNVRIVPYHIYDEHRQRYQVEAGDFAYGRVASVGKIIDLSSNVEREYTYSPTMAIVKPVALYSPYLKGYMNTRVFKGRVDNKTTGSTRKSLGVQDFRELLVYFPEQQEEQVEIGNYFQKLDTLINQHEQKHDKLSNLKKAMLEKMFPKVGESVPEIRFDGFKCDWAATELKELALFNPAEELPEKFKYVDLESVKGTSLNGYRIESKKTAPSRAQRLAKKGDIFYQTVRPYQKNNYLFDMVERDYVFSTGYAQLRPYCDGYFLFNLLQREPFVKDVLDNCTGTSYPAINASVLANLVVNTPQAEEEKMLIGSYFKKLDVLINQHHQQITKLKNIKQACLDKMFV